MSKDIEPLQVSCDVINASRTKTKPTWMGIRTMSNNDIQAGMFVSFESHRHSDPVPQAKKQTARCLVFFSTFFLDEFCISRHFTKARIGSGKDVCAVHTCYTKANKWYLVLFDVSFPDNRMVVVMLLVTVNWVLTWLVAGSPRMVLRNYKA